MQLETLTLMQKTLDEWKQRKRFSDEKKSFTAGNNMNSEIEIEVKHEVCIYKDGTPTTFSDSSVFKTAPVIKDSLVLKIDHSTDGEMLQRFLADFDLRLYEQCEAGSN